MSKQRHYRDETNYTADIMASSAIASIDELSLDGLIDPTSYLKERAVFINSGKEDPFIKPKNQEAQYKIFEHYEINSLEFYDEGRENSALDRETPQKMLDFIFKELGYANEIQFEHPYNWLAQGEWNTFDQREFFDTTTDWDNDENFKGRVNGYMFLPNACKEISCPVHFVFHPNRGKPEGLA